MADCLVVDDGLGDYIHLGSHLLVAVGVKKQLGILDVGFHLIIQTTR